VRSSVRAFSGNIRGGRFVLPVLFNLFVPFSLPHEPRRGEDERHADRDAQACGAVEERPVLRHAGGEKRRPGPGEEEGGGKEEREEAGRGIRLVPLPPRPRKVIRV